MLDPQIIFAGVLNGLLAGGIYVLVAVGLTLIYGVLHIINFAHGSLLMLAMYAVFWLWRLIGVDPYVALPVVIAGAFVFGFVLYRLVIGRFSHGRDENILLITLGLSIVIDNVALLFFGGDTQTIDVPYAGSFVELGAAFLPLPKIISCCPLTRRWSTLCARWLRRWSGSAHRRDPWSARQASEDAPS